MNDIATSADVGSAATNAAEDLVAAQRQRSAEEAKVRERAAQVLRSAGVLLPFIVVLILGVVFVPRFLSGSNLANMAVNAGILALVGYGMTVAIAMRGLDLSVGSAQALTACVVAATVNAWGIVPGILVGLLLGLVLGAINGGLIAGLKVPDFVATLSTLNVFRGAVLLFTGGAPIMIASATYKGIATTRILGLPLPFLLSLLIGALVWVLLELTPFGNRVVAVGVNPVAARATGISIRGTLIAGYMLSGLCAGIGGVLVASQLGAVNGSVSTGLELQAIAIVVLGGTSMMGGRPRIIGTWIAALLLSMINAGLNLLNVPSFYQYVALGALLILSLGIDGAQRAALKQLLIRRAA